VRRSRSSLVRVFVRENWVRAVDHAAEFVWAFLLGKPVTQQGLANSNCKNELNKTINIINRISLKRTLNIDLSNGDLTSIYRQIPYKRMSNSPRRYQRLYQLCKDSRSAG
jgi:hypothetical protein